MLRQPRPEPRPQPAESEPASHVTSVELFFDLVYVFAFTQLSEVLYDQLSFTGALELAVLFVAVWSSWSYTAWATGWIDPERAPVVLLMMALVLASLVMAGSLLRAFTTDAETFARTYVAMQLVRNGCMVCAFGLRDQMGRNYVRVLAWSVIGGAVWIAGGEVHGTAARMAMWSGAAALELAAPVLAFRLPGVASVPMTAWKVAGGHLAERFQLLLTIAFGESFLRIGEAWVARSGGSAATGVAFTVGFVLVVALWGAYFLHHAEPAAAAIAQAGEQAAGLARSAFMYAHAAMVAGVVVLAVSIHLAIEAPSSVARAAFTAVCGGGPALFAVGLGLSKRWVGHGSSRLPLLGAALMATAAVATALLGDSRVVELSVVTVVAAGLAALVQSRE